MAVDVATRLRPLAGHREAVAQHPLRGERRRGEARARHVRRRQALRARRIRHRAALRVDLDPGVVGIHPPRVPARARPAQRRTLARAQDQVLAGIRPRHEARAAGVGVQDERRQPGQRLEYPVRQATLGEGVEAQVQDRHRSQPVEHPRRQRAQRVARQSYSRHSAQPCEVPGLQRRDVQARQLQRGGDPGERRRVHAGAVRHQQIVRLRLRHQRVAHLRRAPAYPADQRIERAVDPVRHDRRHRIVAERRSPALAVDNGPVREQDAVRRHRNAVFVSVLFRNRVAEHQHCRAGIAHIGRPARCRPHLEPDRRRHRRRPGHRHRRREGHAHLDRLAPPVGPARPRHRRQRHRRHRRRRPHRDRDRVARAVAVKLACGRRPLAGHREPVAQRPLRGERRRGEFRARPVRRREALRAGRIRHRAALRVDLDPGVGDVRPPRTSARARPAQRRNLARAQDRVRPGIRLGQEARAAGVAAQVERRQPGQRLEHPGRQCGQRVVRQVETRHPGQACEVPGLQRRDALAGQSQRSCDVGELVDAVVVADLRAVRHHRVVRVRMRHQRFAHLGRAVAHPADQRHHPAIDLVRRVRRHRIVAERRRPALGVGNGPAGEQDAVRRHRDAVVVRVDVGYGVAEHQHVRHRPRQKRRLPRLRPHFEPDCRRPGHRHRRREGHAHLDPLARPVGPEGPVLRRRGHRHRRHHRRRPHRDRHRAARAVTVQVATRLRPLAGHREAVARHSLRGERRRREARPRHVRRREPRRAVWRRHRAALRVDLDPGVVGIHPPRVPARARPAQRRTLARAQDQVRPRIRRRHEARAAGVGVQDERRQPGQRLEYPVRQATLGEGVEAQVQDRHRAQPVEHPRRQRAQRVARQSYSRHSAQPCEVPGLERRDALALQRQRASDPGELGVADLRTVHQRRVVRLRLPQQCDAHLRRALAHPARRRHRRAIDPVRRVRRHRIVAERRRPAVHVGDGSAGEQDTVRRHRDAVVVRVGVGYGVAEHQHRRPGIARIGRPPHLRPHREPDRRRHRRRPGHRHRRREGHAHLERLAPPVGHARPRRRRHRHRRHRRRRPHRDRDRVARACGHQVPPCPRPWTASR